MAVRYYVSAILPPETIPPLDPDALFRDYWRLALDDALPRPSFSAVIPTHPVTGLPLFTWGIAFVQANDWSGVDADPRNFRLFVVSEDSDETSLEGLLQALSTKRWGELTRARQNAINAKLEQLGIPKRVRKSTESLRFVLQEIGQYLQPGFDESKLYVR